MFFKNNLCDLDKKKLIKRIYKNKKPEVIIDYNKNPSGELIHRLIQKT